MKNMESQENYKLGNIEEVLKVLYEDKPHRAKGDRLFTFYTGSAGAEQFDLAILDSIRPNGWIRAYNSEGELRVFSTDEIEEVVKECDLPGDVIWGMLRSKDKETMKLVSEILKL